MAKVTRVNSGIYGVAIGADQFEVERYPDGSWLTFKIVNAAREFIQDYSTKRAAVASLEAGALA